ncbi:MAG: undecaprenyl-diphosphatase UppP [Chloroflexi bacterium]|nr:undecaprenyl-diphosphatase UppP [Chloroflexota bacterium]
MSIFQSFILGLVQGVTEFLPISSTAHLILVPWLLNWSFNEEAVFAFNVLVQLGTVTAVILYFRRDLWKIALAVLNGIRRGRPFVSDNARLGWLVVAATVPAAIIGLLFKRFFEALHHNPLLIASIVAGAAALFLVERISRHDRDLSALTWRDAVIIGCSQALALLPGVSRSAATISGGLVLGLKRDAAARFSFLMSIPILIAASAIAVKDLIDLPNTMSYVPSLAVGFIAAAVVGYLSIHWLLGYLAKRSLYLFAWYRIAFGLLCFIAAFVRGQFSF